MSEERVSPCSNIWQTNFIKVPPQTLCFASSLHHSPFLISPLPSSPVPHLQVQDAVRCRMGGCKDESENSPDSCKNGQVQIMVNSIPFHPTLQPINLELTFPLGLQLHRSDCNTSSKKRDCNFWSAQIFFNHFLPCKNNLFTHHASYFPFISSYIDIKSH